MTRLSMEIGGMSCGHCVRGVTRALEALPGVEIEQVAVGSAVVRFDAGQVEPARITQAIEDDGYAVVAAG